MKCAIFDSVHHPREAYWKQLMAWSMMLQIFSKHSTCPGILDQYFYAESPSSRSFPVNRVLKAKVNFLNRLLQVKVIYTIMQIIQHFSLPLSCSKTKRSLGIDTFCLTFRRLHVACHNAIIQMQSHLPGRDVSDRLQLKVADRQSRSVEDEVVHKALGAILAVVPDSGAGNDEEQGIRRATLVHTDHHSQRTVPNKRRVIPPSRDIVFRVPVPDQVRPGQVVGPVYVQFDRQVAVTACKSGKKGHSEPQPFHCVCSSQTHAIHGRVCWGDVQRKQSKKSEASWWQLKKTSLLFLLWQLTGTLMQPATQERDRGAWLTVTWSFRTLQIEGKNYMMWFALVITKIMLELVEFEANQGILLKKDRSVWSRNWITERAFS